ncbi:hypothetical protein FisN_12Hh246 [Fistulifera solaris]|uniref:Transmembrane protein n=1 Tax=Fistulifera solaris TaxID=1519565 RepID=A0A1Z5KC05_FISSO|nr:hypothetical protein FisN_12Hh246 [Fistulifera solaris]|eukprot:GAX23672.1 hypothetical protein FisN_12Hh246 [Fistulifera solaris]
MNLSPRDTTPKPHFLKQRTSSVDAYRDATVNTWFSAIGLLKLREFLITVDHFSIWKRHLAWALADGKELRDYMTQRYSSSMVFLSLLLSTELSVLFNSAVVTTDVRHALEEESYHTVAFWIGIFIIVSAILSLLGLVATFTAWGMVSAVNEVNAHCVLRSSIGQYVAELPGNLIVGSIYTFSIWLILFFFLLLPVGFSSLLLLGITLGLFLHIITVFSAFGRIIMHSGAMGSNRIFASGFESTLSPCSLHGNLLAKARDTLYNGFSIRRQYAEKHSIASDLTVLDELKRHIRPPKDDQPELACSAPNDTENGCLPLILAGSWTKFEDSFDTSEHVCSKTFQDEPQCTAFMNQVSSIFRAPIEVVRSPQVHQATENNQRAEIPDVDASQSTSLQYCLRNSIKFLHDVADAQVLPPAVFNRSSKENTSIQRSDKLLSSESNDLEDVFDGPLSLAVLASSNRNLGSWSLDNVSPSDVACTITPTRPGVRPIPGAEGLSNLDVVTSVQTSRLSKVQSRDDEQNHLLSAPGDEDYGSTRA